MKKSLLNAAVTIALSSAVFSGSVLSTQAYAGTMTTETAVIADNNNSIDNTTETYMYPGMGVGAASGALVAGPVGLLVGGIIGALVGSNQDVSSEPESITVVTENTAEESHDRNISLSENSKQIRSQQTIQVAQLGEITAVVDDVIESQQDTLIDILTADLSLDVYFRSGSTEIESFYPARLAAIADLMNTMDELELYLDGYSDRRGDKTRNIELSDERIEKVREQLINAGVDENRIISKAFGEMKMVSIAGDLEGYTFDRKVVIRFERSSADSIHAMTAVLSNSTMENETEDADPVVADASTRF
ncbi:MAG: sortase-associated OmpA-like protein PdsO [Gammaproteobacteria bacterium]|nr:sortase-associated OmpA-like protein PdsO [Gammaproteobacteria bacterium]